MSTLVADPMRDLYHRLITAEIAPPHLITRDATLDGRPSVIVYTDDDRQDRVRATLRSGTIEILAGDCVTQTDVLFATVDHMFAYCFIAGWLAAKEHA